MACVTICQKRTRRADGTLGSKCGKAKNRSTSRSGKRKCPCKKWKVSIQDYGPAKRRCVRRAKCKK